MTKKIIDINSWKRKSQFNFFSSYVQPMVGVCIKADITKLYEYCKENNISVFLAYSYAACRAVNEIEELRTRLENDNVVLFDRINMSTTILSEDGQVLFCPLAYHENLHDFIHAANAQIEAIKANKILDDQAGVIDTLHCSTLPWIDFTMMEHPKRSYLKESVPKISFGKIVHQDQTAAISISIHVHHGLADGYHIAQFFERFQTIANQLNV